MGLRWTDIREIADLLEELYPDKEVFGVRFTELKSMVTGLPGFIDRAEGCNERILEAIQMAWNLAREDK